MEIRIDVQESEARLLDRDKSDNEFASKCHDGLALEESLCFGDLTEGARLTVAGEGPIHGEFYRSGTFVNPANGFPIGVGVRADRQIETHGSCFALLSRACSAAISFNIALSGAFIFAGTNIGAADSQVKRMRNTEIEHGPATETTATRTDGWFFAGEFRPEPDCESKLHEIFLAAIVVSVQNAFAACQFGENAIGKRAVESPASDVISCWLVARFGTIA
jgi:hypothetical protein